MYRCSDCGKLFDHEYQLENHVAAAHTRLFTMDNYLIIDGMAVWDYNLDLVTVDLSTARSESNGDVWFSCKTPDGGRGSLMNGERVRTCHPSTNEPAMEALREVQAINKAALNAALDAVLDMADEAAYEDKPVPWEEWRTDARITEYDEARSEEAISIASDILVESVVTSDMIEEFNLGELRAAIQTLVEITLAQRKIIKSYRGIN